MLFVQLFFLLIIHTQSKTIINIDFGTQYLKLGQIDTSDGSMFLRKIYNKFIIPTLISIKVPKGIDIPLSKETIEHTPTQASSTTLSAASSRDNSAIHFITGWKGLSTLHRDPSSGTEFLLNAITKGKDNQCKVFDTPILLNVFFETLLNDLENKAGDFGQFSLTYPTFFTPSMKNLIKEPLNHIPGISIVHEIDTLTALATFYSNYYIYRYHDSKYGRNVLFVDVGNEYIETLFVNFNWTGSRTVATCLVNLWSDQINTKLYMNEIHSKFRVPFSSAEKLLRETADYTMFDNPDYVSPFKEIINKTISLAKQPLDEVQLIGGGSTYDFIRNMVRSVVNESYRDNATSYDSDKAFMYIQREQQQRFRGASKQVYPPDVPKLIENLKDTQLTNVHPDVMTEINPFEGITRGAMLAVLYNENYKETNKNPITIKKEKPTSNYYIHLGSNKVIYCENQKWCQSKPTLQSCIGSDNNIVEIIAENREGELGGVPQGAPIVANRYKLRDLKTFIERKAKENKLDLTSNDLNDFTGRFTMKSPSPIISNVEWCYKDECQPISFEQINSPHMNGSTEIDYSMFSIVHYRLIEAKERQTFTKKTKKALDRMKSILFSSSGRSNERVTEYNIKKFEEFRQMFDNGTFNSMPLETMKDEIEPKLKELCRSLGFRYN